MRPAAVFADGDNRPHGLVATQMIRHPKVWRPDTTVAEGLEAFDDDHVHALLVVDRHHLLAVVERADLFTAQPHQPMWWYGQLAGRTVSDEVDAEAIWRFMNTAGIRRLAVVDACGLLLGLLCLKRSGQGFCSDADIAARALELGRPLPSEI